MAKPFDVSRMTSEEIKFLTKPIATYNNTLIDENVLRRHVRLSLPRTWSLDTKHHGKCLVGFFADLSLETIFAIFATSTIQALMYLRATNSGMKRLIESWPPFRQAMTNARPALMALIATTGSRLWTFTDLQQVIYTISCKICGRYGEVLHLLRMWRVCFNCVTTDRRLLAITQTYAQVNMGLTREDIAQLPHLWAMPQDRFWGIQRKDSQLVIDYKTATERAMVKYRRAGNDIPKPSSRIRRLASLKTTRTRLTLTSRWWKHSNRTRSQQPLYLRRALKNGHNHEISQLPDFLLYPPESDYVQHACSVHLPILLPALTATTTSQPIRTVLCAGCSFYFNYHNPLPHQTHALYPLPPVLLATMNNNNNNVDNSTASPTTPDAFTDHLRICTFARLYWTNLYPTHLRIQSPNSVQPPAQVAAQALTRRITLLTSKNALHRHFQRHPLQLNTLARLPMHTNNHVFEMIPWSLLPVIHRLRQSSRATDLDMELARKLKRGDDVLCRTMVGNGSEQDDRDRFDLWTLERLEYLGRCARERPAWLGVRNIGTGEGDGDDAGGGMRDTDTYGDVLWDASRSVSQALWATARPDSYMCLFRGWYGLLLERKRREEMVEMRAVGGTAPRVIEIGGNGWGFDRFGCVSDLG